MNQNVKTALIIGGVIVALFIILPLVLGLIWGWQGGGWGMMGPGMMGGFGWMWLMPVFSILFLGLIIWAVVLLVRGLSESRSTESSKADSALEVLKKRYARGEINKEEYEEKKKDLV
ncbi:MAG: SHOCT domain-containing protein [Dehalococcoidales bacterium]